MSEKVKKMPPAAGMGRKKGQRNKTTRILKDALVLAAEIAGERMAEKQNKKIKKDERLVVYLAFQAEKNPKAFLPLLGRVMPLQITGVDDGPVVTRIEIVAPERLFNDDNSQG